MTNSTVHGRRSADPAEEHLRTLNAQAWAVRRIDSEKARCLAEEALQHCRSFLQEHPSSFCHKQELATALLILASVGARSSGFAKALTQGAEALVLFEEVGYIPGRIHMLSTLTKAHMALGEYPEAMALVEQGIELLTRTDDPEAKGAILGAAGQIQWSMGDYPKALDYFLQSLAAARLASSISEMLGVLNNLGMVYTTLGDYEKGLEYSNSALLLTREYGDKIGESAALVNIGILHRRQGENKEAKEYFLHTLEINRGINNKNGQMHALTNLASVEFDMGNYDHSEQYAVDAFEIARSTGEKRIESYVLVSLGQLCSKRGQYDRAMEYYEESLVLRRAIGYRHGEVDTLVTIGITNAERGLYDEALVNLSEGLVLAEELQSNAVIFEIHEQLADVYEKSGNLAKALYHHRQFYTLQKAFFNEQAIIRQKSLQVFYEVQQAAKETEIYRLKNVELAAANAEILRQKQDIEEYAQTIRRAHDQLLDKSIALEHLNRDKDEFIGIAVHGLKNPLSLIIMAASMLRMNSERMPKDELNKNLEWIEASAWRMEDLVLKLLQSNSIESGGVEFVPEVIAIEPLLSPIVQEYGRRALAKGIRLVTEGVESSACIIADATMAHDILDNLVSNAVKFSPSDTTISVRVLPGTELSTHTNSRLRMPMLRIAVQDEGPGLTEADQQRLFGKFERLSAKPTGGEHSTGLGLSIVKKLTEMMGGRIWCESAPGKGATFFVELPAVVAHDQKKTDL